MIQVPVDDEVEVQIGEDNQIAARKGGAHKVKALRDKVREAEVLKAETHEAETHEAEVRGELVLELGGEVVVKAPQ